jgi:electron transport complex protein RnfG
MMRTGPFLNAAGKGLRAAVRVTAAVLRVIWRILCAIGRFLHRVFRKDSIPNLILVLALLTAVTAAGLGVIYTVTGPQIEAARAEAFDAAMGEVFPGLELAFVKSSFGENVYEGRDADGNLAGFSILVSPDGYSGPIGMIVGVDLRREVTGVTVVSQRETRGFDAKGTMQNGFLEQFAGKNGPFALGNGIDAISGATISSEAVTQGVNDALALLDREIQP